MYQKAPKYCYILFLFIFFFFVKTNGQTVGLVLSGGGAKGLTHIGVIKALEENNIPIDYIAGTSMGAIICSMYAAGYSPEQMADIVLSEDFQYWVNGKIDQKYVYFFKKKDPDPSWIQVKFADDEKGKLKVPLALRESHQLDLSFLKLLSPPSAAAHGNFDSLYVPFRCVASDIKNSKAYIFKEGNLPMAVRASMTYPLLFRAIKVNGNIMFDGGVYNNFPVDIMERDFNPDIIIGSIAAGGIQEIPEDDLFTQLEKMVMQNSDYGLPWSKGILIKPDVLKYSVMDFDKVVDIIVAGYAATYENMDTIKSRISRRAPKRNVQMKREIYTENLPPLVFEQIYVEGLNKKQISYLNRSIKHKDKLIPYEQFKEEYFRLITDEYISSIYPRAEFNYKTGFFDLHLKVEKEEKLKAKVGGNISSNNINELYAEMQYKYLGRIGYGFYGNLYAGRFYSSVMLKGRFDYPATTPFLIEGGLVLNRWDFFRGSSELFFEDVRPSYIIETEGYSFINAGLPLNMDSKLSFGVAFTGKIFNYYQTQAFFKSDTSDVTEFNCFTTHLTYEINTLNRKQYPTKGKRLVLQARYVSGDEELTPGSTSESKDILNTNHKWLMYKIGYNLYNPIDENSVYGISVESVISSQQLMNNYISSSLLSPSFEPIPQAKTLYLKNFRAPVYAAFGLKYIYTFNDNLHIRLEGYMFQPYFELKKIDNLVDYYKPLVHRYFMASSSIVYHTPLGPASLCLNYFDKEDEKFFFAFNFGYMIFNNRSFDFPK